MLCGWTCDHVCVCVCMRVWEERERERAVVLKICTLTGLTKNVDFLHVSFAQDQLQVRKSIVIQHKIQLSQEIMLWNSVHRSQKRMQLPKAKMLPTLIMKLALIRSLHWGVSTTSFELAMDSYFQNVLSTTRARAHCLMARGSTLANWPTVVC